MIKPSRQNPHSNSKKNSQMGKAPTTTPQLKKILKTTAKTPIYSSYIVLQM